MNSHPKKILRRGAFLSIMETLHDVDICVRYVHTYTILLGFFIYHTEVINNNQKHGHKKIKKDSQVFMSM